MAIDHKKLVADALNRLEAESFVSRLWKRDPTLWPEPSPGGDPAEKTLGWLDLPFQLSALSRQFEGLSEQLKADGFTDVVVLGMGGSSMTPLTLGSLFGGGDSDRSTSIRLHALDTVNPATISRVTDELDLEKTLFFVSSKSGTTVEPLSLEAYFRVQMKDNEERTANRRNFVALTDPGTPLSERARTGEFGTWVATPPDVGGRFSALSAFGMMPTAAIGIDIRKFAEAAVRMDGRCRSGTEANPGAKLGAFLAANALSGRDKVTFVTSLEFAVFGMWVDQLLAESTGKNGKGLVPITGEPRLDIDKYGSDRQFVVYDHDGTDKELTHFANNLENAGLPVLNTNPLAPGKHEIAGEFFRWQFATAAAASLMDIYPFDQPDVEAAKVKSRALLANPTSNIEAAPLADSLTNVATHTAPSYVAITAFLPESADLTAAITNLRQAISNKTGMATTFGYGPRYLHSTGQLYKGGPQNAIVLGFVSGKYDHLAVPGESYTFGQLTEAQAGGDFIVMAEGGQTVLPVKLGDDLVGELETATRELI
jgi:glucose-6-phosphate isomerase